MAEIHDLSLKIKVDGKQLTVLGVEARKVADEIDKIGQKASKSGQQATSTFSQFIRQLNASATRIAFIGGFIGGLTAELTRFATQALRTIISFPIDLARSLFKAGADAEQQILRIGTVLRVPEEQARKAFEAIRAFAAPLPQTTNEIVDAFIRLAAVNLKPTEENLRRVANAALATGESVETITTVLASTETEPLRRLGIELDRTGKKAIIQFKDIRIETEKTTQAVREGLLELFQRAFPDGIERSAKTFKTAFATMQSLIEDLVVGAGSNLTTKITEIIGKINDWISANKQLIQLRLDQFVDLTIASINGLISAIDLVVRGVDNLARAFGPTQTFGPFRTETEASEVAVDLLAGTYGHFSTELQLSEGVIDGTTDNLNELSDAMLTAKTSANEVAAAWAASGKEANALSEAVGFLVGKIKEFNAQPATFAGLDLTKVQQQQAALVNTAITATKLGGVFSGELDPALQKTSLTIGSTTTKFSLFTDEQKETAQNIERNAKDLSDYANGVQTVGDVTTPTTDKIDSLNKSLANQVDQLSRLVAISGLTEEQIIEYDRALTIAKGGSEKLANAVAALRLELLQLSKGISFGELLAEEFDKAFDQIEKARDDITRFGDIQFDFLPESEQIKREGQELLVEVEKIVKQFPILEEEGQKLRLAIVARYADLIAEAERAEYIQRLKDSDSFWDNLKGGFLDFVDQVESNGELISQFFADTLSQMSQNFSDLFFNVITGKFDNLVDVAKQAFEAILRAFLDMVSAIVTREIVISIGGLFGFGKQKGGAGGAAGAVGDAVGVGTDIGGLFGAGGAFATIFGGGGSAIAGTLGGIPIAGGASLFGGASSGALLAPSFLSTIGAAVTIIGAVFAAATLAISLLAPLFKKTPHFAFKFESIETEVGERAATVKELLDPELFDEIFKTLSSHGGKGAFSGKEREALKDAIRKALEGTVESIQAIINKLPEDMAEILNEALLNTTVDMESKIGRSNLLGFDAKGAKEIKERLEKFFQGDLQGRFLFAIRDFFQVAFESLGVLPDKAADFIDAEFEKFKNAGSPEERAQIGQEFLASFNAFVDAFNIISGNANDAISITISSIKSLSTELGFNAIPSIGELKDKLAELLENAELDPETVQKYADLRNAIVGAIQGIAESITGLISKIAALNQTIASIGGGTGVDIGAFLDRAQKEITDFFNANKDNLSLAEQEAFLDEIAGIANAKLAEEKAAFEAAQQAAVAAAEAQKAGIQKRIDALNAEKDKINEIFKTRIDALNKELQIAEDFAQLTESIRKALDAILFSPESVLTGVEQVNLLQSNIARLQADLAAAVDPEIQLKLAEQLRDAFSNLFDSAGEAFGINSPEFTAIFDAVTGGLESLADMTESRGRSVEEISAEIERLTAENTDTLKSIDEKIQAGQDKIASISAQTAQNTFKASQELQDTFKWLQDEYIRILEERFKQLEEVNNSGFATELEGITDIAASAEEMTASLAGIHGEVQDTNGLLRDILTKAGGGAGTEGGTGVGGADGNPFTGLASGGVIREAISGIGKSGRRYMIGEAGAEAVIPLRQLRDMQGGGIAEMNVKIDVNVNGGSQASIDAIPGKIEDMMVQSIKRGRVRKALQEAADKRL